MVLNKYVNIAKKSSPSISLFNPSAVYEKYIWWNINLPYIKPYYAIKSLQKPFILNTLSGYDIGFDVASKREIQSVLPYKKPLIFSHPVKDTPDILYAKKQNVEYLVCDTVSEIEKVQKYYPGCKILWRIQSIEDCSLIKFNNKFGASYDETLDAIMNPSYNIVGISFHVGSMCSDMRIYREMIYLIECIISPIFQQARKKLEIIDIGGGFSKLSDISSLKCYLDGYQKWFENNDIKVVSEPGRYFSNDCISLLTRVINVKKKLNTYHIYINDSIYNSFSGKKFDHQTFLPIPLYKSHEKNKCIIWGNTCDGEDIIGEYNDMYVPKEGEIILWNNMGAYSIANAVKGFNGFPSSSVYQMNDK
jgi:ornithine decarboxylase